MRYLIGVDEAGRGPLAGPVAVGVVMLGENFNIGKAFGAVADSKQLSEIAREHLYGKLRVAQTNGEIAFCVRYASAESIDRWGIARGVRNAIARGVRMLAPETELVRVYLDGMLKAPDEYDQQTIIGGDEAVPIIALASIVAKVSRDRRMRRLARLYPQYGFDVHKGYGTAHHYKMLAKYGPCDIHRRTFLHI